MGSSVHSPTAAWALLLVPRSVPHLACLLATSWLLPHCPHLVVGFDTQHHSPGHRLVFPGQVGLLLPTASGASGHLVQTPLCRSLSWALQPQHRGLDSSGLRHKLGLCLCKPHLLFKSRSTLRLASSGKFPLPSQLSLEK